MKDSLLNKIEKCENFSEATKQYLTNYINKIGYIECKIIKSSEIENLEYVKSVEMKFRDKYKSQYVSILDYNNDNYAYKLFENNSNYIIVAQQLSFNHEGSPEDIITFVFLKQPENIDLYNILFLERNIIQIYNSDNYSFIAFDKDMLDNKFICSECKNIIDFIQIKGNTFLDKILLSKSNDDFNIGCCDEESYIELPLEY